MYKLCLNDSNVYNITDAGVAVTTTTFKGMEVSAIQFVLEDTDIPLKTLKAAFQDEMATSMMEVKFPDGSLAAKYTNYSNLARIGMDENDNLYIVMAEETDIPSLLKDLQKTQKAQIADMKEELKKYETLSNTVNELPNTMKTQLQEKLTESMDTMSETIDTKIKEFKETVFAPLEPFDPESSSASLAEIKQYRIEMSKLNLATYLETHPIRSSVHGGIEKEYSITAEKQQYLGQMIMLAEGAKKLKEAAKESGEENIPEFKPSWNAKGESCTYDWTLEELYMLSVQIEQVVRPLISRQQTMEAMIMQTSSKEEALAVSIEF